jgi:chemotaxis protein MotB
MARRKKEGPSPPTSPGWMTTYGDLMSLLLVFFILLLSFSSMEIVKFREAMGSLKGGEGFFEPNSGSALITEPPSPESSDFESALEELVDTLEENELSDQVKVYWDKRGVRFVMQNQVLFLPGKSEIKERYLEVLDLILGVVTTLQVQELQIEGHTDNQPIATQRFPSNWELSCARAVSVLRYIEAKKILEPRLLVAYGYGEFRPDVPNSSPENRSRNRRVELYVLKEPVPLP